MAIEVIARRRDGYTHDIEIEGGHTLVLDEPVESGGADAGPSPTRALAATLAGCTAITVEMYGDRKGWDLGELSVRVEMEKDGEVPSHFRVELALPDDLEPEQVERILVIAGKCPVHRALSTEIEIVAGTASP